MVPSEDPWLDPDSQWYHHCNRTRARAPPRPFACATRTHNARVRRAGDDVRVNVGTEDLDTPLDSPFRYRPFLGIRGYQWVSTLG